MVQYLNFITLLSDAGCVFMYRIHLVSSGFAYVSPWRALVNTGVVKFLMVYRFFYGWKNRSIAVAVCTYYVV